MARKAKAKLPFLVEPKRQPIMERLGNEETGVIELPRKGYLTVAEKSFVQQGTSGDSAILAMQRLAAAVAKKTGQQMQEVINAMSQGDFGEGFDGYEEELEKVLGDLAPPRLALRSLQLPAWCCSALLMSGLSRTL